MGDCLRVVRFVLDRIVVIVLFVGTQHPQQQLVDAQQASRVGDAGEVVTLVGGDEEVHAARA